MSKVAQRVRRECARLREGGLQLPIVQLQEAADCRSLRAQIRGPGDSPFEGQDFSLELGFGDDYPFSPPGVRFGSPRRIFHPNISSKGHICLDILNDITLWSPAIDLEKLLVSVASLLGEPRTEHGLNNEALALLRSDPAAFAARARSVAAGVFQLPAKDTRAAEPAARAAQPDTGTPAREDETGLRPAQPSNEGAASLQLKDGSGTCAVLLAVLVVVVACAVRSSEAA